MNRSDVDMVFKIVILLMIMAAVRLGIEQL